MFKGTSKTVAAFQSPHCWSCHPAGQTWHRGRSTERWLDRSPVCIQTMADHLLPWPGGFLSTSSLEKEDDRRRTETLASRSVGSQPPLTGDSVPNTEQSFQSLGTFSLRASQKARYSYPTLSIRKERLNSAKTVARGYINVRRMSQTLTTMCPNSNPPHPTQLRERPRDCVQHRA